MKIEYNSATKIDIRLPNGKNVIVTYDENKDELSLAFSGDGHRYIKEMQNRSDGYINSGCTFTEQK